MDRLEQIKNEVAQEKYDTSWDDLLYDMYPDDTYVNDALSRYEIDVMMEEVARRYATEMVRHNLERAAESAKVLVSNGESTLDVKSWTLDDGTRFSPDYRRITSLEIELI